MRLDSVPIVVGVSGHRDVAPGAESRLREQFGAMLERLATTHPSTPVLVLSGLAAGADLLAAEEAFARGVAVMACLPLAADEYEQDFADEERSRFREALKRCADVLVIGTTSDREHGYRELASFLAYYSTVVVAFWDGLRGKGPGGTADVVQLREAGDIGPVFQIVTPRFGQPEPPDSFTLREIYPDRPGIDLQTGKRRKQVQTPQERDRAEFETLLRNLDRFNRDVARETAPADASPILAFQVRADHAADRLQKWTLQSLRWLYVIGGIAIAAQLIVQPPFPLTQFGGLASGVRIGLLAAAGLWFKIAKREDYENRYQDYRAIAEALRVQRAWCSAGLRDRLVESSYLQMQQSELQWIRLALRTIYLVSDARESNPQDSPTNADCMSWIDGQRTYYEAAARAQAREQHKVWRVSNFLLSLGGAISGLAVVASLLRAGVGPIDVHLGSIHLQILAQKWSLYNLWPQLHRISSSTLTQWFLYLMTVPAALLGMVVLLLQFYTQQRGYSENARRYQRMFVVFDAAFRRLRDRVGDPKEVLMTLGHEALSEHADWLILHRERPLRLISGVTNVQSAPGSQQ